MSLNPLAPVTDHHSKLSRIFWFTSVSTVIAVWLLREHIGAIDLALENIDNRLGGDNLPLKASYLIPAIVVGVMSRIFRVYDRISDLLGIRERFEVDVIIAALASKADIDLSEVPDSDLVRHRKQIMGKAFYPFASSNNPQVDEHLIHQALDWWSWLWVVLEATLIFTLTGLSLIAFNIRGPGIAVTFGSLAAAALVLPIIWNQCRRYALAQVAAIMSDSKRAALVAEVMHDTLVPAEQKLAGWHVSPVDADKQSKQLEERLSRHLGR